MSYVRGPAAAFRDVVSNDGSTAFPAEAGGITCMARWPARGCIAACSCAASRGSRMRSATRRWIPCAMGAAGGSRAVPGRSWMVLPLRGLRGRGARLEGPVTVPVLWDRDDGRIVNNESSEIIRMFDREFDALREAPRAPRSTCRSAARRDRRAQRLRLRQRQQRRLQDRLRAHAELLRGGLRQALRRARRARRATRDDALPHGERDHRGRLAPVHDARALRPVYVGHFKCNLRRIDRLPAALGLSARSLPDPGIAPTVDIDQIKRHYYRTHPSLNPMRIVPVGPALDLAAPHGRERLGS